jgi:hypothetical protein
MTMKKHSCIPRVENARGPWMNELENLWRNGCGYSHRGKLYIIAPSRGRTCLCDSVKNVSNASNFTELKSKSIYFCRSSTFS